MIFISNKYQKDYYQKNREKILARAREQFERNNPNINMEIFDETLSEIKSGYYDHTNIIKLTSNPCFYLLSVLTEPGTKTHTKICRWAEMDGMAKYGYKQIDFKMELKSLCKDGLVNSEKEGKKIIYSISLEGQKILDNLENILFCRYRAR